MCEELCVAGDMTEAWGAELASAEETLTALPALEKVLLNTAAFPCLQGPQARCRALPGRPDVWEPCAPRNMAVPGVQGCTSPPAFVRKPTPQQARQIGTEPVWGTWGHGRSLACRAGQPGRLLHPAAPPALVGVLVWGRQLLDVCGGTLARCPKWHGRALVSALLWWCAWRLQGSVLHPAELSLGCQVCVLRVHVPVACQDAASGVGPTLDA